MAKQHPHNGSFETRTREYISLREGKIKRNKTKNPIEADPTTNPNSGRKQQRQRQPRRPLSRTPAATAADSPAGRAAPTRPEPTVRRRFADITQKSEAATPRFRFRPRAPPRSDAPPVPAVGRWHVRPAASPRHPLGAAAAAAAMGLTRQYLRYAPAALFGLVGSATGNPAFVTLRGERGRCVAVPACEHVFVWDARKGEKVSGCGPCCGGAVGAALSCPPSGSVWTPRSDTGSEFGAVLRGAGGWTQ